MKNCVLSNPASHTVICLEEASIRITCAKRVGPKCSILQTGQISAGNFERNFKLTHYPRYRPFPEEAIGQGLSMGQET
jgi:hypothetical protein